MIIAQIATIPTRERTLEIAVNSLRSQVDQVNVIREPLKHGSKFKKVDPWFDDDIIFTCDDDIEYPPDYVATMLRYLRPGTVVTCLGKIMKPRPIESFYRDELTCYKTFEQNDNLVEVEVGGSGVMAYHRATCPDMDEDTIQTINMDIGMMIYCRQRGIKIYCIPHPGDWLKNLMPMLPADTPNIFDRFKNNDQHMTDLINQYL